MEKRIVDLDIAIRSALHHEEPDMTRSISLISELQQLAIQPLMLKKIPNIVMTLRKVRKYIGPVTPHPDPQVCTEISTTRFSQNANYHSPRKKCYDPCLFSRAEILVIFDHILGETRI